MSSNSYAPVFILCPERSGSTLLRYILDTHPDICCPGELFLGKLADALGTTISRTTALITTDDPKAVEQFTWTEVNRILTDLLSKFTQSRGKKLWCDKTPANVQNLEELRDVFPDARYICLHRDSLDTVHSCLEMRRELKPNDAYTPFESRHPELVLSYMLEKWIKQTETILDFEAAHPPAHRVRYEDLIREPVKTLDPLFRFLGLPWEASMLDRVFTAAHDLGGGDEKIRETHRIEEKNSGKGADINPALWKRIPSPLLQRQKKLHLILGYPINRKPIR
jgi:hypothetical protein